LIAVCHVRVFGDELREEDTDEQIEEVDQALYVLGVGPALARHAQEMLDSREALSGRNVE
jgi:hypothetical protein